MDLPGALVDSKEVNVWNKSKIKVLKHLLCIEFIVTNLSIFFKLFLAVKELKNKKAFLLTTSENAWTISFINGFEKGYVDESKGTLNKIKLPGEREERKKVNYYNIIMI